MAEPQASLGIGIVGAGSFGARHAEAIAALDGVHLAAAMRTDPAALAEFCARYGGRGYTDLGELLADPGVEAVVIATPHHLHTAAVEAAAAAGKHILLEKPMAPSLAECDRILRAAAQAPVTLMLGHTSQFAPAYRLAKAMLDAGELGDIVLGVSTMSKFWFEANRRPWHLQRATGGGMWLTAGIHCLDRLTWLVGSPVASVCAQLGVSFHDQEADDRGVIFLRYANGASGVVLSVGYREGAPKHLTELTCTRGMLNIDYAGGVSVGRGEQWRAVPGSASDDWMHAALVEEWRAFAAAVRSGSPPPVTGAYGRHIMAAVLAAEESSRVQAEVPVPDGFAGMGAKGRQTEGEERG
jgi:predicted dehydrogenase